MRRLLVVNPNTTPAVTQRFVAEARALAGDSAQVEGVTGRFGAAIVSTPGEDVVAAHSALDLMAEHGAGADAVILAISFDSGLAAAREVMPLPVVGITEAALRAAQPVGPVGVVIFGEVSRGLYARVIAGHGIPVTAIEAVEIGSAADYLDEGARDVAVLAAVARLAAGGARAAVICGAVVVGIARRLAPRAALPLFDGGSAVAAALAAASARPALRQAPRPLSGSTGLPPRLAALLAGTWP